MRTQVCLTFDIEQHDRIEAAVDYACPETLKAEYAERMETSTRWLLDTLAQSCARATFFVVGEIATTHPELIRDMAIDGHEVACHSWDHRRIHRFTPEEFRDDLRRAKQALEDAAGQPVVGFRAPTFSVTRETGWALDILAEEGMRYDSSIFPVRHDRYGVPDAPRFPFLACGPARSILELPLATWNVLGLNLPAAGGGYFRLLPPAIMHAAVRQAVEAKPGVAVLYFHPWEFDPEQPRLPLSRAARFRTYVGIGRAQMRLQRLLSRYVSIPMIEAVNELERENVTLESFCVAAVSEKALVNAADVP